MARGRLEIEVKGQVDCLEKNRPGAFVSYADCEPDTAVARRVADSLRAASFDVLNTEQDARVGSYWQHNYEKQLRRSHALVAVVSSKYLSQPECRNEVRISHRRSLLEGMLVAPVVIEPIDGARLDRDAEMTWTHLLDCGGLVDGRLPKDEELAELAKSLAANLVSKGIWTLPEPS